MENGQIPILSVADLNKSFEIERSLTKRLLDWWKKVPPPRFKALSDVSFEIGRREILGVVGESGSGKSTLARVLMGLYTHDAGTAVLAGENLFSEDKVIKFANLRRMQMVFQDPFASLDPRMSIREILEEPLYIHALGTPAEREAKILKGLAEVGLEHDVLDRYPNEFSGGQRQRIGICRALVLEPELLIADEAVSALDVSVQAQILELLHNLKESRGISMLFISHDIAVVRQMADRILVLYQGHEVELMPADCLLVDASHPYTQRLLAAALYLREGVQTSLNLMEISGGNAVQLPGCPCYAWCKSAEEICKMQMPRIREIHAGHHLACHKNEKGRI